MGLGMVADDVSLGSDAAGDLRSLANEAADEKERRVHLVLGQHVKQAQGVRIVGAVIESERKLARIRAAGDGRAKDLRLRRHAVISPGSAQTGSQAGGAQQK